jgi:hypothetical protein
MTTLKEAWSWYQATIRTLRVTQRLGNAYWDELPWDGRLGKEERFKEVGGAGLAEAAERGIEQLDDLAIVLFFSLFESIVRERIRGEVDVERQTLRHPVLKSAAEKTDQELDRGSFHRVLELLKTYDPDLVEQVRQVRRYRNWVSHGRRGRAPMQLDPESAYARLSAFLTRLGFSSEEVEP